MQLPLSKVPANIKEIEQMKKRKRRFSNNEVRAWGTYAVRHPLQTLKSGKASDTSRPPSCQKCIFISKLLPQSSKAWYIANFLSVSTNKWSLEVISHRHQRTLKSRIDTAPRSSSVGLPSQTIVQTWL